MTTRNRSSGPPANPPKIFDPHTLALRRARANRRKGDFFTKRCAIDLADRLLDINRSFENVAFWGAQSALDQILAYLPPSKRPKYLSCNANFSDINPLSQDLVISLLRLQSENDPVGTLIQMQKSLKPDGLLIASMFGGHTLKELRHAFYETDTKLHSGVSPHILPFADHIQAAQILSRAGLALPVVDIDRFTINYARFSTLISDLRDLGETNILQARDKTYLGKRYIETLTHMYKTSKTSKPFTSSFEILWLTGWSPDASQQKPAKRGSATLHLGEAIDLIRKKS